MEGSDSEDTATEASLTTSNIRMAAEFVTDVAPRVHPAFGGRLLYDTNTGELRTPMHTKNLALTLRGFVPPSSGIDLSSNVSKADWDELFRKINELDEKANEEQTGPLAVFYRFSLKVGDNKECIDPWLCLIPDDFGLCVVKSAVAIALNFAEWHAEERQKLFDALIEIRNEIGEAASKTKSFQEEPEISRCAGLLHEAIVTAIDEILQSLPAKKPPAKWRRLVPSWGGAKRDRDFASEYDKGSKKAERAGEGLTKGRIKKEWKEKQQKEDDGRKKKKKIDIDDVLSRPREAAKHLNQVVEECKTRTLCNTNQQVTTILEWVVTQADATIKDTNVRTGEIQTALRGIERRQETCAQTQDRTNQMLEDLIHSANSLMSQSREEASRGLFDSLLRHHREIQEFQLKRITQLEREKRAMKKKLQHGQSVAPSRKDTPSRAVITLTELLGILCGPAFARKTKYIKGKAFRHQSESESESESEPRSEPNTESLLNQMNDDLEAVIKRRSKVAMNDQGQAQTVFHQARFREWLGNESSDMILIDGDLGSRSPVTAMSLFCANFVLSMTKLGDQNVCTHFFCNTRGLDLVPRVPGPKGLLQAVIIQLLSALSERGDLSLDFLYKWSQVEQLRRGDMNQLCRVLQGLLNQFSPQTTVYCIIDGTQVFYAGSHLTDLELLVRHLEATVEDKWLKPKFKVLMTVPSRSPRELRETLDRSRYIRLTARYLDPRPLTGKSLDTRLRRSSRSISRTRGRDQDARDEGTRWSMEFSSGSSS